MLYPLCILQGYKMSLILNITPKVISENSLCEIKPAFKNHRVKQLWNTTGLIRFLVYLITWQTSYPSPLPQKTLHGNQAGDKDSALMQFRGKGRPKLSLASHHSHYVTTLAPWIVNSCRGGPVVQNESPALQHLRVCSVIVCFPLLVPAACSNWSSNLPSAVLEDQVTQPPLKRQWIKCSWETITTWRHKRGREEKRISETGTNRQVEHVWSHGRKWGISEQLPSPH